ncbi:hypothetical protein, partial [Morganella morganii]|uniref:hypothetical protein n=1 Tax=Morganella morganii TaxID=582 RepID=UPI0019D705A2
GGGGAHAAAANTAMSCPHLLIGMVSRQTGRADQSGIYKDIFAVSLSLRIQKDQMINRLPGL